MPPSSQQQTNEGSWLRSLGTGLLSAVRLDRSETNLVGLTVRIRRYLGDGSYTVERLHRSGHDDAAGFTGQAIVRAQDLEPDISADKDPHAVALSLSERHNAERNRLDAVHAANQLVSSYNLDLPPGSCVVRRDANGSESRHLICQYFPALES